MAQMRYLWWSEGERYPISQKIDKETRLKSNELIQLTLPTKFQIHSSDYPDHLPIQTECRCENETPKVTTVVPLNAL